MDSKEFLSICNATLMELGFIKKGKAYYLNSAELVGAIFLSKSYYGSAYYVEITLSIHGYNPFLPYPKYKDTDICSRIKFPLKVHLTNDPMITEGYMVDLERNTEDEIKECLKKGINEWMLPAIGGGKKYILDNWNLYASSYNSEKIYAALDEWRNTGELPHRIN